MTGTKSLNSLSQILVKTYEKALKSHIPQGKIRVNPIVSEIASWYEKLRNAMEYREDEVILRNAIERILKRRLILGGSGKTVALPLVRELIWARYFPEESISDQEIEKVSEIIDLYLKLRQEAIVKKQVRDGEINEWIYQVLSSHIEFILNPNPERETMTNYMFHILKDNITISDDSEETRNVQVFIAIRRAYANSDLALLRFHLFQQFFGELTSETVISIAHSFKDGYKEIEKQLVSPARFRILAYIKRQTPPFLILDDILRKNKTSIKEFLSNEEELTKSVLSACEIRYKNISSKVRRAIIRSVIFLLLSKAVFAFAIEGSYERYFLGEIQWFNIGITIIVPPLLMILVGLSIKTPDKKNSERILQRVKTVLFDPHPIVGNSITVKHLARKAQTITGNILRALWIAAFVLSFGLVFYILGRLSFNIISQGVFVFFLTVVTFLAYRIYRTAHIYTVGDKQSLLTPIVDILFLPIAQVGRGFTEGISQINIFLFILDFIIEAPFKAIFGFFEQLFSYFHSKREYLE